MLSILDDGPRLCDGLSRREWLRVGSLGAGGLALPALMRSRAAGAETGSGDADPRPGAASRNLAASFGRAKSVILFWLTGGPPQQETWDMKPEAPAEVRGPFHPVASQVPGMDVCELMPLTARLTDRVAVLRAVVTDDNSHSSSGYQMLTGVPHVPLNAESVTAKAPNLWPCLDSVVRALRPDRNGLPSAVAVPEHIWNDGNFPWPGQDAGFLGRKFDPWLIHCDPSEKKFRIPDLAFPDDVPALRFDRRQSLLAQVNRHLDAVSRDPAVAGYGQDMQQALGLLTAQQSRNAFDLSQEPDAVRERYGKSRYAQSVLLARRLVEAGVSVVRINWTRIKDQPNQGGWDTHAKNAEALKSLLMPIMDQAYSALLEDLSQRGLLDETLVVWIGEFGRTPRINGNAGRDHWGRCFSLAFAGGGVRGGVVHGTSDKEAAYPIDGNVSGADVLATIYHCLGYRPETEIRDPLGRPFPISRGEVVEAVF
jgi:hypothetical protein